MLPIYLTFEELKEITGRVKSSAQIRYLRSQGFTVIPRADGSPLISRTHFEVMMGGSHYSSKPQNFEPDFSSFHVSQAS
jgi:uncharacterized protein DUF4224